MGEPAAGIPRYTGHMNELAAKPATKPRGLRRRHVLVGVGAAAGGLAITKALGLYNLPAQTAPGETNLPLCPASTGSRHSTSPRRKSRTFCAARRSVRRPPSTTNQ